MKEKKISTYKICRIDSERIHLSFFLKNLGTFTAIFASDIPVYGSTWPRKAIDGTTTKRWIGSLAMDAIAQRDASLAIIVLSWSATLLFLPFGQSIVLCIYLEIIILIDCNRNWIKKLELWVMLNIEQRFKALPVLFKHFVERPLLFDPFFLLKKRRFWMCKFY